MTVEAIPTDFERFAVTSNQRGVATYLDQVSGGATGDFATVLENLEVLENSPLGMRAAFDALGPQISPSLATVGLQSTTLMLQQLGGQLRTSHHSGRRGLIDAGHSAPNPVALVSYDETGAPRLAFVSNRAEASRHSWGLAYGFGGVAYSDDNAAALSCGMGGALVGMENMFDEGGRVGFFGGYQGANVELRGLAQSGEVTGGQCGAYVHEDDGFNYYTLVSGLQFSGIDTQRTIEFEDINRVAAGTSDGWQGYGYVERGVAFEGSDAIAQPYVAMQYVYLRQNGYAETGADSLNLSLGGVDANSLRSILGGRLQLTPGVVAGQRWHPELRALWLHEFLDTDLSVTSIFSPVAGGGFSIGGLVLLLYFA